MSQPDLSQTPASRGLINDLAAAGHLTRAQRDAALDMIYPPQAWSLWTFRLMLGLGLALVLSGIVFFYAFNWAKIPDFVKLGSVQAALIACLGSVAFFKLDHLIGKLSLLCASVLVGVFMAVFGQVYQTGADSYQLFMMWSLLILPFTVISRFEAQWVLWLVVANTALPLWWYQSVLPTNEAKDLVLSFTILLNAAALGVREYGAFQKIDWIKSSWIRDGILGTALFFCTISLLELIDRGNRWGEAVSGLVGLIGISTSFFVYLKIIPNFRSHAMAAISLSVVVGYFLFEIIENAFGNETGVLITGIMVLGICTATIIYLKRQLKHLAKGDAP